MEKHVPATPFGRRAVSLGQFAVQRQIKRVVDEAGRPGSNHPAAINKWQLFRTLTEARSRLGISDRALGVLNALLSFHPETALSLPKAANGRATAGAEEEADEEGAVEPSCDLVVFPSNKALSLRAHGMAPSTLWRHLTALVAAGLLARRDSPNGKRYARKAGSGGANGTTERFSHAFGFDLTPLVARAPQIEALADEVRREARARQILKEKISLLRRDAGKLLALGLDEALPGPWEEFRQRFLGLMTPLRRLRDDYQLQALAADLAGLRDQIAKVLESQADVEEIESNACHNAMHHSNSKYPTPADAEPASRKTGATAQGTARIGIAGTGPAPSPQKPPAPGYPLGLVMEACPDISEYAEGGRVRSWQQFGDVVGTIRPMLGISPDAWAEARETLGDLQAHIVVAMILQRSEHSSEAAQVPSSGTGSIVTVVNGSPAIRSAGGYLRALTEQARAGAFQLGPVLMALIGQRLKAKRARPGGSADRP